MTQHTTSYNTRFLSFPSYYECHNLTRTKQNIVQIAETQKNSVSQNILLSQTIGAQQGEMRPKPAEWAWAWGSGSGGTHILRGHVVRPYCSRETQEGLH